MALTDISKLNIFLGETDTTTAKTQAIKWACGAIEEYCNREFEQVSRSEWLEVSGKGRAMVRSYPLKPGTNAIVRTAETAIALTLATGNGGVVSQRDPINGKDALTLDNNGVVSNLIYSDYANLTALVAAINLISGWSARITGNYTFAHLAPCSIPVTGGVEVRLDGPGMMLFDYSVNNLSGIICGLTPIYDDDVHVTYTAGLDTIPTTLEMIATQMSAAALRLKPENPGMKSESFGDYSYTKAESEDLLGPYMKILNQWRRPVI